MNREGRRFARLFRQARGLQETRQCDLEAIADEDGIEIVEFDDSEPGCAALLLPNPDGKGGVIFLQPGGNLGRKRFSIAHELAHYHIPTHKGRGRSCADLDLQAGEGFVNETEWEANTFAAELLMPERLFGRDSRDRGISFGTVGKLACDDMYAVSRTAAAIRLVNLTREACALVAVEHGRILWQVRSGFYYRMPTRGMAVRPSSIAAAVLDGDEPNPEPVEVDPYAWLDEPQDEDFVLLESTHEIPRLGQVLSLLWVPEDLG